MLTCGGHLGGCDENTATWITLDERSHDGRTGIAQAVSLNTKHFCAVGLFFLMLAPDGRLEAWRVSLYGGASQVFLSFVYAGEDVRVVCP